MLTVLRFSCLKPGTHCQKENTECLCENRAECLAINGNHPAYNFHFHRSLASELPKRTQSSGDTEQTQHKKEFKQALIVTQHGVSVFHHASFYYDIVLFSDFFPISPK